MALNTYICLDGEFMKTNEPCFHSNNRAFRYGDSLVEKIHASSTEPQFLSLHLERLMANMKIMSMVIPSSFTVQNFHELIVRLLNKNRIFGGAGIRLVVYRKHGEDMVPDGNIVSFLLESYELENPRYTLNEKGLNVEIYTGHPKIAHYFSGIPGCNVQLNMLAGIECKNAGVDTFIFLNQAGRMVEGLRDNLFLVSGNSLFTPGTDQGCVQGIMRKVIIRICGDAGYNINEMSSLTPASMDDAEEVFLTNAIDGIRWVGAYRQIRYFRKVARFLVAKLNEEAFKA